MSHKDVFYKVLTSIVILFLALLLFNPLGTQINVFFAGTHDLFADYYNIQRYIANWDPYFNPLNGYAQKCFLPLPYCIYRLFGGFADYGHMSLQDCWSSTTATMSALLFTILSAVAFFHSIKCLVHSVEFKDVVLICLSSVFLFTIERGSMTPLTVAGMCYFMAFKDIENKLFRKFSLLAICFAATLKIYPVILGFFLLKEKRYKDIIFCVIAGLMLAFLPFLTMERGFANFPQLISNVAENTQCYTPYAIFPRYGIAPTMYPFLVVLHIPEPYIDYLLAGGKLVSYLLTIASFIIAYFSKNRWNTILLLSFVMVMFPENSALYCGMYLIPIILMYLKDDSIQKSWFYTIGFVIFLSPLQLVIMGRPVTYLISNIVLTCMWVWIIYMEFQALKVNVPKR